MQTPHSVDVSAGIPGAPWFRPGAAEDDSRKLGMSPAFPPVYFTVKGSRAFTLVELIVVLVVLSVTVMFILPQFSHIAPTGSVQKSARQLSAFFAEASTVAQEQSRSLRVHYTPSTRTFTLEPTAGADWEADRDPGEVTLPQLTLNQTVTVRDVQLYTGGTLSTGTFSIQIDRHGYLQPAVIHLQEDSGSELTLQLEPFLGAARVLQGYVSMSEELFH